MGQSMVGRLAIKAKQIKPGDAFAAAVPAGGLIEIIDLEGKQVAELVAFDQLNPAEHLSLGVTRQQSKSIMLSHGMKLYSSRGRTMMDLIEDTVGWHDLLWSAPTGLVEAAAVDGGPVSEDETPSSGDAGPDAGEGAESSGSSKASGETDGTASVVAVDQASPDDVPDTDIPAIHGDMGVAPVAADGTATASLADHQIEDESETVAQAEPLTGFPAALAPFGLAEIDAPDPVNFFMQLAVMQRGDLELRAPLSQRGDRVVLEAMTDLIVAVRCSAATDETNGESPSDILVRIYR